MSYYTLRSIGLILLFSLLYISPLFSDDAVYFDYIKVRKQIEDACFATDLSIEQRAAQIYSLLPVTDENMTVLNVGPKYEDRWDFIYKSEGRECSELLDKDLRLFLLK